MLQDVLSFYPLSTNAESIPFGSGLINHTWLVRDDGQQYILQKVNTGIFKHPAAIASNIDLIAKYLSQHSPDYLFVTPISTTDNQSLAVVNGGYYRMFPYVVGSHTIDVVHTIEQAYEAAKQFGRFTNLLKDFPADELKITLPDFHNLTMRFTQFETACKTGNPGRIQQAAEEINFLQQQHFITDIYRTITTSPAFKKRVTHHDTKISNVLFNAEDKGLCVIDLDTVMAGYFISDVGDMIRTYVSPVSEEEKDLTKIELRDDFFEAIIEGYLSEMNDSLTEDEKGKLVYSGFFMIYMQAIRFLTDHLNNDVYYGAAYEGQNFSRAQNQVTLLKRLMEKEEKYKAIVSKYAR